MPRAALRFAARKAALRKRGPIRRARREADPRQPTLQQRQGWGTRNTLSGPPGTCDRFESALESGARDVGKNSSRAFSGPALVHGATEDLIDARLITLSF